MTSKSKGALFLLNNKTFTDPSNPEVELAKPRRGSEKDLANMSHVWKEIGYEVYKFEDLRGQVVNIQVYHWHKQNLSN